jgi:two-component sensor histidine kinase/PAS domain-containing protein
MDDIAQFSDRYRAVFDAMDEGACIIRRLPNRPDGRRDYRYVAMNPAMRAMFGIADLTGQTIRDNFPDEVESWYDDYDRVLETGVAARILRESEPQHMVLDMFVSSLGASGELLVVMRNVQQKQKEREDLRRSREKYKLLFDSIDEGFCIIEVLFDETGRPFDYRFLEANPAFELQTGLVGAVGRTVREFAPHHEEHWFQIYGKIVQTGEAARFEDKAEALGRWYDVYAFRIGAPEDRKVAVLFRDVLPRRQMEQALRESEGRARALVNASSDVVYRMSPDWQEMRQLDGRGFLSSSEGRTIRWLDEYILPEDQELVREAVDSSIRGRDVFELEHRVRQADGSVGWVSSRAVPMFDDNGDVIEWFGMAADITDRRRSEEQRKLMNEELAHRLKNLFAIVNSVVAQTLRTAPDMPTAQRTLSERIGNMARAQEILFSGQSEAASVRALIEATLSAQAESRRIDLSGPDVTVGKNAALAMALVVHELLTNAIKHGALSMPEGRVEGHWSVDTGPDRPDMFCFEWREIGGPAVTPPTRTSFGTRLIRAGLASGSRGETVLEYLPGGVHCRLSALLADLQEGEGRK